MTAFSSQQESCYSYNFYKDTPLTMTVYVTYNTHGKVDKHKRNIFFFIHTCNIRLHDNFQQLHCRKVRADINHYLCDNSQGVFVHMLDEVSLVQ